MKQTIDKGAFRDAFHRMGRGDQFSHEALGMIYDYLTELEEETGTECELDPIGVCCEFTEYADIDEFREAYDHFLEVTTDHDAAIEIVQGHVGAVLRGVNDSPIVVAD